MIPDPTLRKRTCNVCGKVFPTKRKRHDHFAAEHLGADAHSFIRACARDAIARRPDLDAIWRREMASTSAFVEPLSPELKARADREWEML